MNATVPSRGKVQSLVAPLKRDSGVVRVQLHQVVPQCFTPPCAVETLSDSTSFAHIGHPLGSCDSCWMFACCGSVCIGN